jgi:glycosyltransferase involved in cell wall biosynthesis
MRTPIGGKKVLFISHDASRSGAPVVLLHLLRWLKGNSDLPFHILLRDGGALEPDFAALAPVSNLGVGIPGSTTQSLLGKNDPVGVRKLTMKLRTEGFGLVYANTVENGDVLEVLSSLNCPVICHVHELEFLIRYYTDSEGFKRVKQYTDHYIAASEAVRQNLIANHSIPEAKIETVHSFIPIPGSQAINQEDARAKVLERLNIPREALIVGASGQFEWWKAPDLFVQLARSVRAKRPPFPVHFMWVGGELEGRRFGHVMHEIKHAGLEKCVHLVGHQPDPLMYYAACDVFALVSREDSFPLTSLEAASLGKPVVCFGASGGAKEFVEDDCGYIVPYLDVESMAARVIQLLASRKLRERFGRRAAEKVRERHDVSVAAPRILEIITQFLKRREKQTSPD